ncbi:MAG: DUF922 domain-containing protein [Roseovarius sp.]
MKLTEMVSDQVYVSEYLQMVCASQSTMTARRFYGVLIGLGVCLLTGTVAFAEPNITVSERPYKVDAITKQGLLFQMSTRGPVGFWAFTRTNVAWRGQCNVTVKIRYTMPEHAKPQAMPPQLQAEWTRMITAMRKHEEQHGQHAINAGREIEQAGCVNGLAILRKWRGQDRSFDVRTSHGKTQGVVLQ